MTEGTATSRPWLRFSLRSLLIVTTIVAAFWGGWISNARRQGDLSAQIGRAINSPPATPNLSAQVHLDFQDVPLRAVLDRVGEQSGTSVSCDGPSVAGMANQPVTIHLRQPISAKSALNLVLQPLGLKYRIQRNQLVICAAGHQPR